MLVGDALASQRGGGPRRGREMPPGQSGDQPAVEFLGKRVVRYPAAQARLDVRHRDPFVEGGERPAQRGRRVALDDDDVRAVLAQGLAEALGESCG
jgi:hypothetical protein